MEDTLEVLAVDAEQFNEEQKKMNVDLESKKDVLVMTNDRKKYSLNHQKTRGRKAPEGSGLELDQRKANRGAQRGKEEKRTGTEHFER